MPRTALPLLPACLACLVLSAADAAPVAEGDPARARVAAQCAAFWEGAGHPERAGPFRKMSERDGGDPAFTRAYIDRLRPAMARLAEEATTEPRAAELWARHARLCGGGPAPSP